MKIHKSNSINNKEKKLCICSKYTYKTKSLILKFQQDAISLDNSNQTNKKRREKKKKKNNNYKNNKFIILNQNWTSVYADEEKRRT